MYVYIYVYIYSCLVVWNIFYVFHILGIVIPTDELIFFRGVGLHGSSTFQDSATDEHLHTNNLQKFHLIWVN